MDWSNKFALVDDGDNRTYIRCRDVSAVRCAGQILEVVTEAKVHQFYYAFDAELRKAENQLLRDIQRSECG